MTQKIPSPKPDDVLRRMLSTPPKQHVAPKPAPVKKRAKKKPAK
jgi:hypothetical protein